MVQLADIGVTWIHMQSAVMPPMHRAHHKQRHENLLEEAQGAHILLQRSSGKYSGMASRETADLQKAVHLVGHAQITLTKV